LSFIPIASPIALGCWHTTVPVASRPVNGHRVLPTARNRASGSVLEERVEEVFAVVERAC
jgi:hypothetical protein